MAPYKTSLQFPTAILVVNIIGLTLSFISVVLRLWARHVRNVKWRLSDYTIIASWVSTALYNYLPYSCQDVVWLTPVSSFSPLA